MPTSIVIDHVVTSFVVWFGGAIAGAVVGFLCSLGLRSLYASFPQLPRFAVLIPWRTVVMCLLGVLYIPVIVALVGLGETAVILTAGFFMFLLAFPFTVSLLLENSYPTSLGVRFVVGMRTLATASPVIVTVAGLQGGAGIGFFMYAAMSRLQYNLIIQAFWLVVAIVLVIDLLLGIAELIVSNRTRKVQPQPTTGI